MHAVNLTWVACLQENIAKWAEWWPNQCGDSSSLSNLQTEGGSLVKLDFFQPKMSHKVLFHFVYSGNELDAQSSFIFLKKFLFKLGLYYSREK